MPGKSKNNKTRNTKNTNNDEEMIVFVAPDGGWGWVVAFSSFMVSVLVDGVCFSVGILFPRFMDLFNVSKMQTSWVGSVLNGTYMVIGPFVSGLVGIYGCRRVAILGVIIASISFLVSTFSPNIGVLTVTYGLFGGIGLGFMYLPAIVMVGYYFEKRRALATGIACCGSGIGGFVFAPLLEFLLNEYDWQGAIWILSAIVLNGIIFSALYRPLEGHRVPRNEQIPDEPQKPVVNKIELVVFDPNGEQIALSDSSINNNIYRCKSLDFSQNSVVNHNYSFDNSKLARMAQSHQNFYTKNQSSSNHDIYPPLLRKDIFYSGSIRKLHQHEQSRECVKSLFETENVDHDNTGVTESGTGLCAALQKTFDISVLLSPTFLVYGASCFLCMAGFFVPFMYLPSLALGLGISLQNAAYLISIIGIVNTLGRVITGFISDKKWTDCLLINNIALILGGIATMVVPFLQNFGLLVVYCCVFGVSIAVFVSLRSIIMVELMGLEKLTSAFGFVIMCQGLSSLIGAPIAGALSDSTGNFDASFYLAGAMMSMAGAICLPLRRIASWEKKKLMPNEMKGDDGTEEISPMILKNDG